MKDANKEFFETAYRTGSDVWSMIPYHKTALQMLPRIEPGTMTLDVGSGRGGWLRRLVKLGLRVIGIDYVQGIVDVANEDIKAEGLQKSARFMLGDVRDIPFTDKSFGLATSIGVLHHLDREDWDTYAHEIHRVLKPGGYFLNVVFSRDTTNFLDHNPKMAKTGDFKKFGLKYYFFTEEELEKLFKNKFVVMEQRVRFFDSKTEPEDGLAMVFTLMQKK